MTSKSNSKRGIDPDEIMNFYNLFQTELDVQLKKGEFSQEKIAEWLMNYMEINLDRKKKKAFILEVVRSKGDSFQKIFDIVKKSKDRKIEIYSLKDLLQKYHEKINLKHSDLLDQIQKPKLYIEWKQKELEYILTYLTNLKTTSHFAYVLLEPYFMPEKSALGIQLESITINGDLYNCREENLLSFQMIFKIVESLSTLC